ncbi:MAG: hypothetical protein H6739_34250 [Alphaproteobacteria bacterium]|nr:hypothetical protein [Alphaproteobacteria bacterium]
MMEETSAVKSGEQDAAIQADGSASVSTPALPEQRGLLREFMDFIIHEKAWWMTPIIIVLVAMVAFILYAEASPVLPFIYTVF